MCGQQLGTCTPSGASGPLLLTLESSAFSTSTDTQYCLKTEAPLPFSQFQLTHGHGTIARLCVWLHGMDIVSLPSVTDQHISSHAHRAATPISQYGVKYTILCQVTTLNIFHLFFICFPFRVSCFQFIKLLLLIVIIYFISVCVVW